jgi:arylsulfatase A-like enzyme
MSLARREFLKLAMSGPILSALPAATFGSSEKAKKNVLFIAVDDLNDWVGCLGGHPQAKTPNIDRFAEKGVLFEQAYCAAPLCNPSRTAIMTGLNPSTTGIYCNQGWFRDIPEYEDWQTIPQYFSRHGYITWTGGKIYHMAGGKFSDAEAWDKQYSTKTGTPFPPKEKRYRHGLKFKNQILQRLIDWGPIEQSTEETNDWKTADLAARFLRDEHDKPFFLACGIYRPHLTWYAPKEYFDMHPLEKIELPAHMENDLDDVPAMGRRMAGVEFNTIREAGYWKHAVQGYLASCSFADACVGRVLEALEASRYADNTIVVLWGDHGYHIGEKDHFAKSALWEQTSRTPLIIYDPGVSTNNGKCKRAVGLVDLYPTTDAVLLRWCEIRKSSGPTPHSSHIRPTGTEPTTRFTASGITTSTIVMAARNCMTMRLILTGGRIWLMTRDMQKPKRG